MYKNTKKQKPYKKIIILTVAGLIGLAVILLILEKTKVTDFVKKPVKQAQTISADTKGEPDAAQPEKPTDQPSQQNAASKPDSKAPETPTGPMPKAPSGSFVSNYEPNLDGNPKPNVLESVCITTPGAVCQISFIKGSVTKSLEPTVADKGGAVYWTWNLKDLGLSEGSWKIKATATLNGKVATSDDPLTLEVKP